MQHTTSRANGGRTRTGGLKRTATTGLHAMAATVAQTYGNPNENDGDGGGQWAGTQNRRQHGRGSAQWTSGTRRCTGSTAGRYWCADPDVGWAWGKSPGGGGRGYSKVVHVGKGVVGAAVGRGHLLMGVAK